MASPQPPRTRLFLAYTEPEFANAYTPQMLARLQRCAEVTRNTGSTVLAGPALVEAAGDCDLIVGYRSTPCDAATLRSLPRLKAFIRAAVDISTIDLAEASRLGVLVLRGTPGFHNAVAELGMGMLVDLARGITRHRLQPDGGQGLVPGQGRELGGATLGFIGYGGIACRMSALARAFGMRTLACDPWLEKADIPLAPMEAVLRESDFVVCLAAANERTRGLLGERAFSLMRRGAFFVNLSRGELVDEEALEHALDTGHLAGAALDVGSAPDQKPARRFVQRRDVVITQHIGATTTQARCWQTMDAIKQAEALASHRLPRGAVNLDVAYRIRAWLGSSLMEAQQ